MKLEPWIRKDVEKDRVETVSWAVGTVEQRPGILRGLCECPG